ncbi:hypothetical protein Aph01nite_69920 [Acrocarpospora phusangensis]|uniref:Uncharacterized protein n=1 Tax=Acrocarpospora phusangensis TaxID=1070424 RepID=A0A919US23_9ACTN|nr:hypothetical protein [Acrocarpospora phusangensis]GIH28682.1 hypothetical protein Aph01nite_69920 [Acrocarpospora phusangensis]
MTNPRPRRPTAAQRAVLLRIRDEVVRHNPLSPRRSGIPAATLSILLKSGWIAHDDADADRENGRRLILTDAGEAALAEG